MSFRFRLERVLKHRQRRVDECTRLVASARRDVELAAACVSTARDAVVGHTAAATAARSGSIDTSRLQRATTWREQLQSRLVAAIDDQIAADEQLKQTMQDLESAWRDQEILQRLKERQAEAWRHDQQRRERRQLDEVGAIRAALAGYRGRERSRDEAFDGPVASEKRSP